MKTRLSFVSNSSSTSFVVIGKQDPIKYPVSQVVSNADFGETEFGWGPDVVYGAGSLINFAFIQTDYGRNPARLEILERVIKEHLGDIEIIWEISEDAECMSKQWGYIDHASSHAEGQNLEIFESDAVLKHFLFSPDSKIVLDNDNH